MVPALFILDFSPEWKKLGEPVNLGNLLFLGLGASALCFASWNWAVKILGAVRTSVYIYLVPVVTVATAVAVLHERITVPTACGMALAMAGLALSETGGKRRDASAASPEPDGQPERFRFRKEPGGSPQCFLNSREK